MWELNGIEWETMVMERWGRNGGFALGFYNQTEMGPMTKVAGALKTISQVYILCWGELLRYIIWRHRIYKSSAQGQIFGYLITINLGYNMHHFLLHPFFWRSTWMGHRNQRKHSKQMHQVQQINSIMEYHHTHIHTYITLHSITLHYITLHTYIYINMHMIVYWYIWVTDGLFTYPTIIIMCIIIYMLFWWVITQVKTHTSKHRFSPKTSEAPPERLLEVLPGLDASTVSWAPPVISWDISKI